MSTRTGIEWTEATWNPVTGCTKVSPGCDHCYAERITERFSGKGTFATVALHPDRLTAPLRWRQPRRVFVNSMSDLFHADVPDEFIARVFAVMGLARRHTFQVLTKRHARTRSLLRSAHFEATVAETASDIIGRTPPGRHPSLSVHGWRATAGLEGTVFLPPWPLPNVWLGMSVETQQWADRRIPALIDTPAAVRFLSCEPLLGPVDISWALDDRTEPFRPIDWVIVGGESGPGARPMDLDWARGIVGQCTAAGVPVFVKQLGSVLGRRYGAGSKGGDRHRWPADLRVRDYPREVVTP
ncbi:MAG: DUF5131 family protein [Streptosporangiales bacterium]|nr:DUF5131 family protein [Streptosporangiales bacterium]